MDTVFTTQFEWNPNACGVGLVPVWLLGAKKRR
jgi:hypothetical protein